jgi:citrate synthase
MLDQPNLRSATVSIGDTPIELPLLRPTVGPPMLDLKNLYAKTGAWTYDPGLGETGSCRSAITYVDGEAGVMLYRGYPIEELVENADYPTVCRLLLEGELPDAAERRRFMSEIVAHAQLPPPLDAIYRGFRPGSHPMAMMMAVAAGLAGLYDEGLDIFDVEARALVARRLIGLMPTIAAIAYRTASGEPVVAPRPELGYAANFLSMLFAKPGEDYRPLPEAVAALEALLIVQADHEQNASTSAMRLVGSTRANPYACLAAAIAALWGPLHGGANEAALDTLAEIGGVDRIPEALRRAKDRNDPFRLSGFGHRVYKSYDPRAKILRQRCHQVLGALGRHDDPLLTLAIELERAALADDYFISRKLYPNVDFYSGIIFRALGLPATMFTPVFAVARTVGWVAHWDEMAADPETRIFRPRQLYCGPPQRNLPAIAAGVG